jgi:hypothetical protein
MTGERFPVDDFTLDQVEHALGARLAVDSDGTHSVVGADFSLSKLLEFLSGYDPTKVVPMLDEDGYEIPDRVEYTGPPVYTRDCVIRALIAEVRRLRSAGYIR